MAQNGNDTANNTATENGDSRRQHQQQPPKPGVGSYSVINNPVRFGKLIQFGRQLQTMLQVKYHAFRENFPFLFETCWLVLKVVTQLDGRRKKSCHLSSDWLTDATETHCHIKLSKYSNHF